MRKIEFEDIEQLLRLVEAQRDLAYHLQKLKESIEQKNKEMQSVIAKAQRVQMLKSKFKGIDTKIFTKEEVIKINQMLQQRHIRI